MRRLALRSAATLSCAALSCVALSCAPTQSHAALLRPFSRITTSTVHLTDLFDELGTAPDRVLGAAPAPGARIVVPAAQLAAIARDFNVAWRPASGGEQVVIERRGDLVPRAAITGALRVALHDAGAPQDCDVATPDLQPIVVPAGSTVAPEISQLTYDEQGGHFTALVSVSVAEMPSLQLRVSGQVVPMVRSLVAARRLAVGTIVGDGDLQLLRVRAATLHGNAIASADAAAGMQLRHDVAAGQPLTTADLLRPPLVLRGALVRMRLDSEGIALTAQGIATQAGARGDSIRVENPVSHRVVQAEVTGADEVRVAPNGSIVTLVSTQ